MAGSKLFYINSREFVIIVDENIGGLNLTDVRIYCPFCEENWQGYYPFYNREVESTLARIISEHLQDQHGGF